MISHKRKKEETLFIPPVSFSEEFFFLLPSRAERYVSLFSI
jgi:hypothetical protein